MEDNRTMWTEEADDPEATDEPKSEGVAATYTAVVEFLAHFESSLYTDTKPRGLQLPKNVIVQLLPTFTRLLASYTVHVAHEEALVGSQFEEHVANLVYTLVSALPRCDFNAVSGSHVFDILQNMCDVMIYYCFTCMSKLATRLSNPGNEKSDVVTENTSEVHVLLTWILRGLLTSHPARQAPGTSLDWSSVECPFDFQVNPATANETAGSKAECETPTSPKLPTTPADFRSVAQYLLHRDEGGCPPSPILPASPHLLASAHRQLTSSALLSSPLTSSPPLRPPDKVVKKFGLGTLVQHNLVYAVSVVGIPVTRILDLSSALLGYLNKILQSSPQPSKQNVLAGLFGLVSELFLLGGRVPHTFGAGYVSEEDTPAINNTRMASLLQQYVHAYTSLYTYAQPLPKSGEALLPSLVSRESVLSSVMTVIAKWAPERFKLQYLFFASLNTLAIWTSGPSHNPLGQACHTSGLVCYALHCINNLLSLCTPPSSSTSNDITISFLKSASSFTIPAPKDVGLHLEEVAGSLPKLAPLPLLNAVQPYSVTQQPPPNAVALTSLGSPSMGPLSPHELLGAVFSLEGTQRGLVYMCLSLFKSCTDALMEASQAQDLPEHEDPVEEAVRMDVVGPASPSISSPRSPSSASPSLSRLRRVLIEPFKDDSPIRGKRESTPTSKVIPLKVTKSITVVLTMLVRIFSSERLSLLYILVSKGLGDDEMGLFLASLRKLTTLSPNCYDEIRKLTRELSDLWFQAPGSAIQVCRLSEMFATLKESTNDGLLPLALHFDLWNFLTRMVTHSMIRDESEEISSLATLGHEVWMDFIESYSRSPVSTDLWGGYFAMEYADLLLLFFHLMGDGHRREVLQRLITTVNAKAPTLLASTESMHCPPVAHILRMVEYMLVNISVRMPSRCLITRLRVAIAATAPMPANSAASKDWLPAGEHKILAKWSKSSLHLKSYGEPKGVVSHVRFYEIMRKTNSGIPNINETELFTGKVPLEGMKEFISLVYSLMAKTLHPSGTLPQAASAFSHIMSHLQHTYLWEVCSRIFFSVLPFNNEDIAGGSIDVTSNTLDTMINLTRQILNGKEAGDSARIAKSVACLKKAVALLKELNLAEMDAEQDGLTHRKEEKAMQYNAIIHLSAATLQIIARNQKDKLSPTLTKDLIEATTEVFSFYMQLPSLALERTLPGLTAEVRCKVSPELQGVYTKMIAAGQNPKQLLIKIMNDDSSLVSPPGTISTPSSPLGPAIQTPNTPNSNAGSLKDSIFPSFSPNHATALFPEDWVATAHDNLNIMCGTGSYLGNILSLGRRVIAQHCLAPIYAYEAYPLAISLSHVVKALAECIDTFQFLPALKDAQSEPLAQAVLGVATTSFHGIPNSEVPNQVLSAFSSMFIDADLTSDPMHPPSPRLPSLPNLGTPIEGAPPPLTLEPDDRAARRPLTIFQRLEAAPVVIHYKLNAVVVAILSCCDFLETLSTTDIHKPSASASMEQMVRDTIQYVDRHMKAGSDSEVHRVTKEMGSKIIQAYVRLLGLSTSDHVNGFLVELLANLVNGTEVRQALIHLLSGMDVNVASSLLLDKLVHCSVASHRQVLQNLLVNLLHLSPPGKPPVLTLSDDSVVALRDRVLGFLLHGMKQRILELDHNPKDYFEFTIHVAMHVPCGLDRLLGAINDVMEDYLESLKGSATPHACQSLTMLLAFVHGIVAGRSRHSNSQSGQQIELRKLLQVFKQYSQWFPPKLKRASMPKSTSSEESHNALLSTPGSPLSASQRPKPTSCSKQCTIAWTGKDFKEQAWYFCYTCFDETQAGCCSMCAATCHLGHDVVYAGWIPSFCDCGLTSYGHQNGNSTASPMLTDDPDQEDPVQSCCTSYPTLGVPMSGASNNYHALSLFASHIANEDVAKNAEGRNPMDVNPEVLEKLLPHLLKLIQLLLPSIAILDRSSATNGSDSESDPAWFGPLPESSAPPIKWQVLGTSGFMKERSPFTEGTLDSGLEYDALPNSEVNLLQPRTVCRHASASSMCGWVAFAEQSSVVVLETECLLPAPGARGFATRRERSAFRLLSKGTVPFKIVSMEFNPWNGKYLVVGGLSDIQVLVISGGSILQQVVPQLSLSSMMQRPHILQLLWLPYSHVALGVVTNAFVKVYNLSQDLYCPFHNYNLMEGTFVSAAFCYNARTQGESPCIVMFALTSTGTLYSQELAHGDSDDGPIYLTNALEIECVESGKLEGSSIFYSNTLHLLFISCTNGRVYTAQYHHGTNKLYNTMEFKARASDSNPSPLMPNLRYWTESIDYPGTLAAIANSSKALVVIYFQEATKQVHVQNFPLGSNSNHIEGVMFLPTKTDQFILSVYMEDGSVRLYEVTDPLKYPAHTKLLSGFMSTVIRKQKMTVISAKAQAPKPARRSKSRTTQPSAANTIQAQLQAQQAARAYQLAHAQQQLKAARELQQQRQQQRDQHQHQHQAQHQREERPSDKAAEKPAETSTDKNPDQASLLHLLKLPRETLYGMLVFDQRYPTLPVTAFEKMNVLDNFQFTGAITTLPFNQQHLRRVLADASAETYIRLPSRPTFNLSIQNTSTDQVICGIRVRLGPVPVGTTSSEPTPMDDDQPTPSSSSEPQSASPVKEHSSPPCSVMLDTSSDHGPSMSMGAYRRDLNVNLVRWYGVVLPVDDALAGGKEMVVALNGLPEGMALYQVMYYTMPRMTLQMEKERLTLMSTAIMPSSDSTAASTPYLEQDPEPVQASSPSSASRFLTPSSSQPLALATPPLASGSLSALDTIFHRLLLSTLGTQPPPREKESPTSPTSPSGQSPSSPISSVSMSSFTSLLGQVPLASVAQGQGPIETILALSGWDAHSSLKLFATALSMLSSYFKCFPVKQDWNSGVLGDLNDEVLPRLIATQYRSSASMAVASPLPPSAPCSAFVNAVLFSIGNSDCKSFIELRSHALVHGVWCHLKDYIEGQVGPSSLDFCDIMTMSEKAVKSDPKVLQDLIQSRYHALPEELFKLFMARCNGSTPPGSASKSFLISSTTAQPVITDSHMSTIAFILLYNVVGQVDQKLHTDRSVDPSKGMAVYVQLFQHPKEAVRVAAMIMLRSLLASEGHSEGQLQVAKDTKVEFCKGLIPNLVKIAQQRTGGGHDAVPVYCALYQALLYISSSEAGPNASWLPVVWDAIHGLFNGIPAWQGMELDEYSSSKSEHHMLTVMLCSLLLSTDLDNLRICTARGLPCSMRTAKASGTSASSSSATASTTEPIPSLGPEHFHAYDDVARSICDAMGGGQSQPMMLTLASQLLDSFEKNRDRENQAVPAATADVLLPTNPDQVASGTQSGTSYGAQEFSPFFSPSYALKHPNVLHRYNKQLTVCIFQVVYSILCQEHHNPTPSINEVPYNASIPKVDRMKWQDLCDTYLSNDAAQFIHGEAKRVLLMLCGSRDAYHAFRDQCRFSRECKKAMQLVEELQNQPQARTPNTTSAINTALASITRAATRRPANWWQYCKSHSPKIISFLMDYIEAHRNDSVIYPIRLLCLYLTHARKLSPNETFKDVPPLQCLLYETESLHSFVTTFLLDVNSTDVHTEAAAFLRATYASCDAPRQLAFLTSMVGIIPSLPAYGRKATAFNSLLRELLAKASQVYAGEEQAGEELKECVLGVFKKSAELLCMTFQKQNALVAGHPNAHLYESLRTLVHAFNGYFLESDPCLVCSDADMVPYAEQMLNTLQAESKYNPQTIFSKFHASYSIKRVDVYISDPKNTKQPKDIDVYYSNKEVKDVNELKLRTFQWRKAGTIRLEKNQTRSSLELAVPVTCSNLKIHFENLHEDLQLLASETLLCPSCSQVITDRHGQCLNCEYENAYQCRQCRNINHEQLDAFLCNECGWSRYGRFDFTVLGRPHYGVDTILSEEDRAHAFSIIASESEKAHAYYSAIKSNKASLLNLLSNLTSPSTSAPGTSDSKVNANITALASLYCNDCCQLSTNLSKTSQILMSTRQELYNYIHRNRPGLRKRTPSTTGENKCFGCATAFLSQALDLFRFLTSCAPLLSPLDTPSPKGSQKNGDPMDTKGEEEKGEEDKGSKSEGDTSGTAISRLCHEVVRPILVDLGIIPELFHHNIHRGDTESKAMARSILCSLIQNDRVASQALTTLVEEKVMFCLKHHTSMDVTTCVYNEMLLLIQTAMIQNDNGFSERIGLVLRVFRKAIEVGSHSLVITERIIQPCLQILSKYIRNSSVAQSILMGNNPNRHSTDVETQLALKYATKWMAKWMRTKYSIGLSFSQTAVQGKRKREDSKPEQEPGSKRRVQNNNGNREAHLDPVESNNRKRGALPASHANVKKRIVQSPSGDAISVPTGSWFQTLLLSQCSDCIRKELVDLITKLTENHYDGWLSCVKILTQILPEAVRSGEAASHFFKLYSALVEPPHVKAWLVLKGFFPFICQLILQETQSLVDGESKISTNTSHGIALKYLLELLHTFLKFPSQPLALEASAVVGSPVKGASPGASPLTSPTKPTAAASPSSSPSPMTRYFKKKKENISHLLDAYLSLRGIIIGKTKLTTDCTDLVKRLIDMLITESDSDKRSFISACLVNFGKDHGDAQNLKFIMEQLINLIVPPKPEAVYQLMFKKKASQEDFIRGHMSRHPYSSNEIGTTMRHVSARICRDLDLFLDADFGLELLVDNKIISLDLPVALVYEQVWRRSASYQEAGRETPMVVVYRLQGLDGEATEEIVDSLEEQEEEDVDPETKFGITDVVGEGPGLDVMLNYIKNLDLQNSLEAEIDRDVLTLVLDFTNMCSQITKNRRLLAQKDGIGVLLSQTQMCIECNTETGGNDGVIQTMLSVAASVAVEISKTKCQGEEWDSALQTPAETVRNQMASLLNHLSTIQTNEKLSKTVFGLLPFLTRGDTGNIDFLIEFFSPHLEYKKIDAAQDSSEQAFHLKCFVSLIESLERDSPISRLIKDAIRSRGITSQAIEYIQSYCSMPESELSEALERQSLPHVLRVLTSLLACHPPTQELLVTSQALPLLHRMEKDTKVKRVAEYASFLLDELKDSQYEDRVNQLRDATLSAKKKKAEEKRLQIMQKLNFSVEKTHQGTFIQSNTQLFEDIDTAEEEDSSLQCIVCREGYNFKPEEVLGVYTFARPVEVDTIKCGKNVINRHICYTTVSHFNIIHYTCHRTSAQVDASMKPPKMEWEGATIRNLKTKCNNLLPICGPSTSPLQYKRHVSSFLDRLHVLKPSNLTHFEACVFDFRILLSRLASKLSFSVDSQGGGPAHNMNYLPFLVQLGLYLLDDYDGKGTRTVYEKALGSFLGSDVSQTLPPCHEYIYSVMTSTIFLMSWEDWQAHKYTLLQHFLKFVIRHKKTHYTLTYSSEDAQPSALKPSSLHQPLRRRILGADSMWEDVEDLEDEDAVELVEMLVGEASGASSSGIAEGSSSANAPSPSDTAKAMASADSTDLFTFLKPILTFTCLINELQTVFKKDLKSMAKPSSDPSNIKHTKNDEWVVAFKNSLKHKVPAISEKLKEVLDTLSEELYHFEDVQEFLDVFGVLPNVLSENESVEDFMGKLKK